MLHSFRDMHSKQNHISQQLCIASAFTRFSRFDQPCFIDRIPAFNRTSAVREFERREQLGKSSS